MARNKKTKAKREAEAAAAAAEGPKDTWVQPVDPPRAVVAVHPHGAAVAVAVGPELRVYDAKTQQHRMLVSKAEAEASQAALQGKGKAPALPCVRGVAFDASGRFLLAGTEDKAAGLRLWDCATWELLQAIKVPKKVTCCCFTADGAHVLAADKFGDVLVAAAQRPASLPAGQAQEPETLLGHYCAILTSLSLSSDGRLLATTDRDQRVRVSIVPAEPLGGAHEIQAYCLGHTAFVTCSAFVARGDQELLVTGGGDGTLRLWDPLTGELLHTLQLPPLAQPQGEAQPGEAPPGEEGGSGSEGEGEEGGAEGERGGAAPGDSPVPLALAASPDGSCLVAAVDGRDELCLLRMDWAARQLAEGGWAALPGLHLPASLAFAGGLLWAAGGPVADDSTAAFLACGSVAAGEGGVPVLAPAAPPAFLPAEAVRQLEAQTGEEAALLAAAAEQRRLASQQLRRRKYSLQELEHRKRQRRDKVAAAAAAEQQQQQQPAGGQE